MLERSNFHQSIYIQFLPGYTKFQRE